MFQQCHALLSLVRMPLWRNLILQWSLYLIKTYFSCKIDAFPQIQTFPNFSQIQKTSKFPISSSGGTNIANPFPDLHSFPIPHLPPLHLSTGLFQAIYNQIAHSFYIWALICNHSIPTPRVKHSWRQKPSPYHLNLFPLPISYIVLHTL